MVLTDKQYAVLLDLYHEMYSEFRRLSEPVQRAFCDRLYRG